MTRLNAASTPPSIGMPPNSADGHANRAVILLPLLVIEPPKP